MAPKVTLFVDYQNAHLSAHHHWCEQGAKVHECLIDPLKLAERVIARRAPGGVIEQVRVYRGKPNPRKQPEAAAYSDRAAAAWTSSDPRVQVFRRDLKYPSDWGEPGCVEPAREKGVDVALAVDLVAMAIGKEYEVGIVFSRDTDLEPAVALALKLGAHTEVATWAGRSRISLPGGRLYCHHLDEADFQAARDVRNYDYVKTLPRPRGPLATGVLDATN